MLATSILSRLLLKVVLILVLFGLYAILPQKPGSGQHTKSTIQENNLASGWYSQNITAIL